MPANGLDFIQPTLTHEFHDPGRIIYIGDHHLGNPTRRSFLYQFFNRHGAITQAVLRMDIQIHQSTV